MLYSSLLFLSAIAYLFAGIFIVRLALSQNTHSTHIEAGTQTNFAQNLPQLFISTLLLVASFCHIGLVYYFSFTKGSIDISFSSMVILVSCIIIFIFFTASLFSPIKKLGMLLYPATALCLLLAYVWQSERQSSQFINYTSAAHIIISILAFSFIALATIQSLLFLYQDRQLKNHRSTLYLNALPPLLSMEMLIFKMLWIGFILLSFTLLTGALFSQQLFSTAFQFNHHVLLAMIAWCCFAIILYQYHFKGLRGSTAVKWVSIGFIIMNLGYFGTKMISELLNT